MKHAAPALLLLCLAVPSLAVAADPPALQMTVTAETVTVTGITPGGSVVFFAVSREPLRYRSRIVVTDRIDRDVDQDGRVSIPLGPLPVASVWTATDLATGAFAIAAFPERPDFALPDTIFVRKDLDGLEIIGRRIELSWVQPGTGAWGLSAGDGGASDTGLPGDTKISPLAERMQPVGASPPAPKKFSRGDRIIYVDLRSFQAGAVVVGKE